MPEEETEREIETPLPPTGQRSKPKTRRNAEPTYEELNPHVCGVGACRVRESTELRMAEHRENVHNIPLPTTNGELAHAAIALPAAHEPEIPFDLRLDSQPEEDTWA